MQTMTNSYDETNISRSFTILTKTYGLYSSILLRKAVTIKSILSTFEHKLETIAVATIFA